MPTVVVVMGVSGSGKTTLGRSLADALGGAFVEADDFHSDTNRAAMSSGRPLTDDQRWPWLAAVAGAVTDELDDADDVVVACSALRRRFRDYLVAELDEVHPNIVVWFLELTVPLPELKARLEERTSHFMPASLLDDQLATLEALMPDELAATGARIDGGAPADQVLRAALTVLEQPAKIPQPTRSWLDEQAHRRWLESHAFGLVRFMLPSIRPEGGFYWLDADGQPLADRPPLLFLTARMTYAAACSVQLGVPGAGELLDHGMASLLGLHADHEHGGWISEPGADGRKSTYDHMHVGLAAAAAQQAGHPDGATLLQQVIDIVETRLWDESAQMLRESFAADWSDDEDYRGANANMHGVEAMLAIGKATGDPLWHERALSVADRLVNVARQHAWLMPEHYTREWRPILDYNRDEPMDPFRPYGATLGHSLEWARFLLELATSSLLTQRPEWLVPAAEELARRALDGGWAADGIPGLPYTVDWDGTVVAGSRLHWPVTEAIQASAALRRVTGDRHWENWYRKLWDHAARYLIDDRGTWRNELDDELREAGIVWPGRPDIYHSLAAALGPLAWPRS